MTTERFLEDLALHGWRDTTKAEDKDGRDYVLYEKDGLFLFLIEGKKVTDALYGASWVLSVSSIRVLRNRHRYLELESEDGKSYELFSEEDEVEVGCQG